MRRSPYIDKLVEVVQEPCESFQACRIIFDVRQGPVLFGGRWRASESEPGSQLHRGIEVATRFFLQAFGELRASALDLFAVHHEEALRLWDGLGPHRARGSPVIH